jgi:hypothetical protein
MNAFSIPELDFASNIVGTIPMHYAHALTWCIATMEIAISIAKQGYTQIISGLGTCFQTYANEFSKTHARPCQVALWLN